MAQSLTPVSVTFKSIHGSLQDFNVLYLKFAENMSDYQSTDYLSPLMPFSFEYSVLGWNTISRIQYSSNNLVIIDPDDSQNIATVRRVYDGATTFGTYLRNSTTSPTSLFSWSFSGANFYYAAGIAIAEFADGKYTIAGVNNRFNPSTTNNYLTLTPPTNESFGYMLSQVDPNTGYAQGSFSGFGFSPQFQALAEIFIKNVFVEDSDPYAGIDGESDIPSGGSVSIPSFPPATATATGIVGLFAPSEAQMQALADYMWTDFGGQGTTVVDVLTEIQEAIKRSICSPLDYVLGLNIIPSQGLSIGASQVVRFGFFSTGVSMPRLASQYFTVDCGTLHFDPLCGDTFLDYAPYSKFSIYLPYIGARELDANDCVGHTIGVVYHGDTVTGGVTAYITKDGTVVYQFSGSCALSIPLSSDGWGSTISAAVQIATTIATAGAAAGSAGVAKAAAQGAASVAANPSLLSPQVAHSGAVSGAAGCMGVQYPYIIREAVRFHSTAHFNTLTGYPSFYFRDLSEVSGYTRVLDVHLSGVPATQDEISEIETLLKEGVEL